MQKKVLQFFWNNTWNVQLKIFMKSSKHTENERMQA